MASQRSGGDCRQSEGLHIDPITGVVSAASMESPPTNSTQESFSDHPPESQLDETQRTTPDFGSEQSTPAGSTQSRPSIAPSQRRMRVHWGADKVAALIGALLEERRNGSLNAARRTSQNAVFTRVARRLAAEFNYPFNYNQVRDKYRAEGARFETWRKVSAWSGVTHDPDTGLIHCSDAQRERARADFSPCEWLWTEGNSLGNPADYHELFGAEPATGTHMVNAAETYIGLITTPPRAPVDTPVSHQTDPSDDDFGRSSTSTQSHSQRGVVPPRRGGMTQIESNVLVAKSLTQAAIDMQSPQGTREVREAIHDFLQHHAEGLTVAHKLCVARALNRITADSLCVMWNSLGNSPDLKQEIVAEIIRQAEAS